MKNLIADSIITLLSLFWFIWFLGNFVSFIMAASFYINFLNVFDDIQIIKLENRIKKMEDDK